MTTHTVVTTNTRDNDLRIDFDGTTVLCRVCGDKASGFHYGVHSCEGCKGFFRRSIQHKIQYRPCAKGQQCEIMRINRNRCQYCRLKKCISVGMSRDAVRFGRVPKKEKAKILAAMQLNNRTREQQFVIPDLENDSKFISEVIRAHKETRNFDAEKVMEKLVRVRNGEIPVLNTPLTSCPLHPQARPSTDTVNEIQENFYLRFKQIIDGVIIFGKRIPGFMHLPPMDQATLLKSGMFEVVLARLACMFESQTNTMLSLNGMVIKRDCFPPSFNNAKCLMDSMFDFSKHLNALNLTQDEIALFCGILLIAPDRPGLKNVDLVRKIHNKLVQALQSLIVSFRPNNPMLFQEIMKKGPDLRVLNQLHSEKLFQFVKPNVDASQENHSPLSHLIHNQWEEDRLPVHQTMYLSPNSDPYGNPRSVDSGHGVRSPGGSSTWSTRPYDSESICSVEVAQISDQIHGDQMMCDENDSQRCNYAVNSPDSGIESGKEHPNHSTPTASICSSPRSSIDEKVIDSEVQEKNDTIDDMPVLKRALQAPPLTSPSHLMNETYKPHCHKKFRAWRKDSSDGPCSPEPSICNSSNPQQQQQSTKLPLASSHSTLVQKLKQGPNFANEQHQKRNEMCANMIMTPSSRMLSNMLPAGDHPTCNQESFQPIRPVDTFIPSSSFVSSSTKMTSSHIPMHIPPMQTWPANIMMKVPSSTNPQVVMPRMYYDPRNSSPPCSVAAQSTTTPATTTTSINNAMPFGSSPILLKQLAAPLNTVAPSRNQTQSPQHPVYLPNFAPTPVMLRTLTPPNNNNRLIIDNRPKVETREGGEAPLNLSKRTTSSPEM